MRNLVRELNQILVCKLIFYTALGLIFDSKLLLGAAFAIISVLVTVNSMLKEHNKDDIQRSQGSRYL